MRARFAIRQTLVLSALALAACSADTSPADIADAPGFRQKVFFLEAPCAVMVEGVGMVDIEEDYIPGVVACENGGAPLEALKAQAVQARSFLYYKLFVAGQTTIRNSTADQVYSCSYRPNGPDAIHRQAAEETKAQYLSWEDSIVASFYVAGAIPPNPNAADPYGSCMANGGSDPTSTQRWVTYNRGKSGCDIDLTDLGFVPADCRGNPHNRGCASQNGEACLAGLGIGYQDMLKYYYGDDIVVSTGDGLCGSKPVSVEDQFCIDNGDGDHCLDTIVRIECAGGVASLTETCDEGCSEGACLTNPDPTFCTGRTDGAHCNGTAIVQCAVGEMVSSESCQIACQDGVCTSMPSTNNGTEKMNNATGSQTSNGGEFNDSVPPVVGPSPGVEGGCSTMGGGDAAAQLLAFAIIGIGSRRRRSSKSKAPASHQPPRA